MLLSNIVVNGRVLTQLPAYIILLDAGRRTARIAPTTLTYWGNIMKMQVSFSMFCDAFRNMGRENQFTYDGKRALYDYLLEFEEDMGEEIELDVIALCCEYAEYSNGELIEEYGEYADKDDLNDPEDDDEYVSAIIEALRDETVIIECDNGNTIIQNF